MERSAIFGAAFQFNIAMPNVDRIWAPQHRLAEVDRIWAPEPL